MHALWQPALDWGCASKLYIHNRGVRKNPARSKERDDFLISTTSPTIHFCHHIRLGCSRLFVVKDARRPCLAPGKNSPAGSRFASKDLEDFPYTEDSCKAISCRSQW